MSAADDQNTANVAALTVSIQQLVSQLLANGNIADATTSIKEAIEVSATSNVAAIGAIVLSATNAAASAKVTADDAAARVKVPKISLQPGAHDPENIID